MYWHLLILGAAFGAGALGFRFLRRRAAARRAKAGDADEPLVSLVLLLREEKYLDAAILTRLAGKAWGVEFATDDPEAAEFVVGETPSFVVQAGERAFLVNNFDGQYVNDVEDAADRLTDMRLQKAMVEHRAWLSVDLLAAKDELDEEGMADVYRRIGRLVAELIDDDCLAIYSPAEGRINVYGPSLEETLRGDDPLAVFRGYTKPPVIGVSGDDPRMLAAVFEARRRWPEFVRAFENRGRDRDRPFSVKAPFTDGDETEFMWMTVTAIENDVIYGILDNEPVDLVRPRKGDKVRVQVEDLNDWLFTDGEGVVGGFTLAVIRDAEEGK